MEMRAVITAEEYEALDEVFQGMYKQNRKNQEEYILQLPDIESHPTVRNLAATLKRFKDIAPDAKGLEARIASLTELEEQFESLPDADEIKVKLERLKELEENDGDEDKQRAIEALRDELTRAHGKEKKALEERIESLESGISSRDTFINRRTLDADLNAALQEEPEVMKEYREAVRAFIKSKYKWKIVEEDNEYRAIFETDLGDVTAAEFIAKWKTEDEAQPYLPPSGNTGTGTRETGPAGGYRTNPWKKESWNVTKQGEILSKNPTVAKQMAAAAGVTLTTSS